MRTPDDGGHWGILGGTFDPVHNGHLNLAMQVMDRRGLDGVLLVPSYRHPFKEVCRASFGHRLAMLKLAAAADERLRVSEIEREQNLSGYTIDSVKALRTRYPNAVMSFVIGEDNLDEMDRWRRPDEIFAEVRVLVGQRPPHQSSDRIDRFPAGRIEMVEIDMQDVSSTDIRDLLKRGTDFQKLDDVMPSEVVAYIRKHGLYR
jgi:nicotinate-nucleotide adenylyltransferase